jgi:hypothetical protein
LLRQALRILELEAVQHLLLDPLLQRRHRLLLPRTFRNVFFCFGGRSCHPSTLASPLLSLLKPIGRF